MTFQLKELALVPGHFNLRSAMTFILKYYHDTLLCVTYGEVHDPPLPPLIQDREIQLLRLNEEGYYSLDQLTKVSLCTATEPKILVTHTSNRAIIQERP